MSNGLGQEGGQGQGGNAEVPVYQLAHAFGLNLLAHCLENNAKRGLLPGFRRGGVRNSLIKMSNYIALCSYLSHTTVANADSKYVAMPRFIEGIRRSDALFNLINAVTWSRVWAASENFDLTVLSAYTTVKALKNMRITLNTMPPLVPSLPKTQFFAAVDGSPTDINPLENDFARNVRELVKEARESFMACGVDVIKDKDVVIACLLMRAYSPIIEIPSERKRLLGLPLLGEVKVPWTRKELLISIPLSILLLIFTYNAYVGPRAFPLDAVALGPLVYLLIKPLFNALKRQLRRD
jgi:hypothetical protein